MKHKVEHNPENVLIICFRKEELGQKQTLDSLQRQLRELKESKTNRLKRFGQHMPDLCGAIENAYRQRQFKYKPIGPLGNLLTFIYVGLNLFQIENETANVLLQSEVVPSASIESWG